QAAVDALVASGIGIGASAIQADGSGTITQNIKVNILSAATQGEVAYLTSDSDRTIATTGGTSTITVKAFNSDGTALGGKTVKLNLNNVPAGLDVKVDAATKTTAADGTAQFNVTYTAPTVLTPEQIKALLAGIQALATYTNSAGKNTTQSTMLQFYADQVNIQRMDLVVEKGLALVVNTTTSQELLTTVTLKDKDGNLIKNRQVTVSLDDLGTDNNILFTSVNFKGVIGGSTVVSTDANGQAVVTLEVHPDTQKAVDALVASGIGIRAAAVQGDGSGTVTQSLKINVLSEASQNEVGYLTSESNNTIATTGGSSIITVKAFSADNKALSGKAVKLSLNNVPAGVNIQVDQASQTTDATGSAKFNVTYNASTSLTPEQIKALLAGIQASATYTTSANKAITQNTVIQFYADQVNIQRMDLVVDKSALVMNTTAAQTVKTTVTLKDRDGQAIKNRQVTLALNAEAVQNGVSFAAAGGLIAVSTDANGQAEIILSINPTSQAAVDALVASGIGIGASAIQADGSGTITQNVKVNILSEASQNEVASLITESNNAIGTAGGTSTITVKTLNSDGKALGGKAVKLSLNNVPVGLDVKVDTATQTTALDGTAQFIVTYTAPTNLTAEQIKALLAGIQANAVYTTSTNKNITQSTMLQFYVDQANIQRMDLVVDKAALVVNTTAAQTVKTTVTLKDQNGQVIKNRQVTLALNAEAVQNGVSFAGATGGLVVVSTNANGQAIIDLNVNPTTENAVNALMASGIGITASAVQSDGSGTVTQNTKVSISSEAVGYMTVNSSGLIATTGGTSTIIVKAFNSTGTALSGKTIQLGLNNVPTGLDIKLDMASKPTNGNGEATFTVTYNAAKVLTPEQIQGLLSGVQVIATYTNNKGINTTQNMTQQFAIDQVNIQRMDLVVEKPSLVMDTSTPQTVLTTVTLKDKNGNLIKGRQVTLAIDNWGVDNNIIRNSVNFKDVIGGSTVVETDANGQAVVVLEVKTTTKEAVDTLAASGIGISASATQGDGSGTFTQTTQINVSSAATLSELSYLTLDNVNGAIKTTGGTTTLIVKAFNNKGKALAGKLIKLALNNVPAGLTINVTPTNQTTGADGSVNFTVTYTAPANLSAEQIKGLLAGVQATATYTHDAGTNVTQNTVLQFVADEAEVAKDAQRVELVTSKGIVTADNDTFTFTTKVFDKDGNPLKDKLVGFGLNAAATANGVTFVGGASKKTDVNGNATFTVNVKAGNDQMIENLVANGITLAASVVQADGSVLSQTMQVMVKAPVAKDVVALTTTLSEPVISVLGGTSIVAVKAEDANGNPLANKEINFGLAAGLSSRVKVDKTSATTNVNGIAYFTVTVENGDSIDQLLVEKGITYAVSTYNNNSTTQPVVTQVGRVNVSVPTEAMNLSMNTSKDDLLASGDTSEVFAKLVDNTATGIKSYPVTFNVIDSALNGVTINGQETAVITTDTSGNAKVTLKLTKITGKQYTDLLANGVDVRASITLPNGVVRTQTVHFNVNQPSSNYHLVFSNVSKSAMDVNGDRSIVTVTLLDRANQPVRNQEVTLAANNAGGLTIGNPGSSGPVNTSGGPVTVKTDSNGNAFFSVAINGATVDKDLLLASGIELTATNTDEIGEKATQIYRIATVDNSGTTTVQPARYSLRIAAKPTMSVRDDTADVTVTLLDTNGGGVSGKYITLGLTDFARNGAVIVGASGLTTDANGQAVFKIKVDENARRNYTATEFVNDDLHLTARFSETGYADATQISMIDIVQAAVQAPVASIVIGVNPTEVASSSDGVYYTKNMSVSVVDFDGKPLANQVVTLDSTPLTYIKGRNLWALAPKAGSDPAQKWVFAGQPYYDGAITQDTANIYTNAGVRRHNNYTPSDTTDDVIVSNIYLDSFGRPVNSNGTVTDLTDDVLLNPASNNVHACAADPAGTAVGANNTPVKVVTFVSQSGAEQNTFTTDANGKFDFAMRYPKIYAQWLTVQVGASATVASLPNRTTYSLGLASLASDYSSDGTYSPNEVSPYGTSFTCP
ncbi:beta strand repeat-containing protein, partial [Acinetobacter sp. CIP 102129]|uniref:beta strand repeat-containing protein n=1 Tax=Acinetobacter sp. CIP 102129 TaxID=1144664 RepID=UPI0002CE6FB8